MSGKDSFPNEQSCTSGSTRPLLEKKQDVLQQKPADFEISSLSNNKCVYDSKHSDSGVWSGFNIHSEEIHSPERPSSPISEPTCMSESDKVNGDNKGSTSYMRLDSGIDVSQHLSELSLRDNDSNDLSVKDIINISKDSVPVETTFSNQATFNPELNLLEYWFSQNEDGDTQLHLAVVHNFIETVYALVRSVPNQSYLNKRNLDRQTALHLAVLTQQPGLVRLLVSAGAALDELDCSGNTPLHLAVQASDLACVRAIIDPVPAADISKAQLQYVPKHTSRVIANMYNYEGQTCLHLAALSGNLEIFKLLLRANADINAKEWKGGQTPLHLAVESRNLELCVFLLSQEKLNPEEISYAGHTAYQTACSGWDLAIADTLREHGVDTYESDSDNSDDDDMLESSCTSLPMNGGLVGVGA